VGDLRKGPGIELARLLRTAAFALSASCLAAAPLLGQAEAGGAWNAVKGEVVRWGEDSVALVKAPASWGGEDWTILAATVTASGGLMAGDRDAYGWAVRNQTASRDDTARLVSKFGAEYSVVLAAGLFAGGLAFGDPGTRDTGRDAVEASILTGLITNVVMKPAFGRERPYESDGATTFHPFSSYASFPSGHAAQAFTVATVLAMRSDGWIVPTISYTVASLVAVSRVYQQAHFPSDTFAGAVLGNAVARFVVNRSGPKPAPDEPRVAVLAIPGGLAVHVSY
jgi:hypothetical protein